MKPNRYRMRAGLAVAAALPLVAGALAMGTSSASAADSHGRQVLANTLPVWATARADHGAASGSTTVNARVYLAGRDAKGLADYARAVSDPTSPQYGRYLTASQVQERFGASAKQVSEVTSWLKSAGMRITARTEHYIAVSGDKAAVEKAFGTELHDYAKSGHTYHAPSTAASVPASLNGAVLTVTGLDNAPSMARNDSTTGGGARATVRSAAVTPQDTLPPPEAVFRNSGPYSTYYGSKTDAKLPAANGTHEPYVIKGYTGDQLRAAYGAKSYTGKGVTVAVIDAYASPTIAQDAATYAERNGGAAYKAGQLTQVLPDGYNSVDDCGAAGWYGEESLDIEAVHSVAPAADISYVGAASCEDNDLLDALSKVVDHHLADIVSNSWSDVEADSTPDSQAAYDQVFEDGASEGIGFYFSTGDDGDELASTGTKQVGTPSDSPWATAVGGTSLAVGGNGKYEWETGWGTEKATLSADGTSWTGFPGPFTSGAGGGTSVLYAQPYYQRGIVPASLSEAGGATKPMRVLPDISAVADPTTGLLVGQTQTFPDGSQKYSEYRIGGTSLSCPVTAAIQALAQQARGGVAIGFANPAIYERYGTPALHDVTDHPLGQGQGIANVRVDYANSVDDSDGLLTSLRSFGLDSSLSATVGYDDVTGVGSPGAGYVTSYLPHHH